MIHLPTTIQIIITDLYNEIFPIIRYEIGDYGSIERSDKYPYLFLKNLHSAE